MKNLRFQLTILLILTWLAVSGLAAEVSPDQPTLDTAIMPGGPPVSDATAPRATAQPGRLNLDFSLGSEASIYQLRSAASLNPGNVLNQDWADGDLLLGSVVAATWPWGLHLQLKATARWFNWNQDSRAADLPANLAGNAPALDFSEWKLAWTSADGLVDLGLGKQFLEPGPGRQLKAANYLGWLFGDSAKSFVWIGLNQELFALKFLWAPRAAWVPELLRSGGKARAFDSPALLPGGDIWLLQGQLFLGDASLGLFGAWDKDFTAGLWGSLPVNPNLILYAEASFTTKSWMPQLDATSFGIDYQRKNGLRAMAGMLWSPEFIDLSSYLEIAYNGDAWASSDWQTLGTSLTHLDGLAAGNPALYAGLAAGARGRLATAFPYSEISPFNIALHLKPNALIAEVLDWSLSLNYGWPDLLFSRLYLALKLKGGISLQATWDIPWDLAPANHPNQASAYLWQQRLTLSASILAQTSTNF